MFLPRRTGPHWRTVSRMRRASTWPRKQHGNWSRIYQVNSNMSLVNSLCKTKANLRANSLVRQQATNKPRIFTSLVLARKPTRNLKKKKKKKKTSKIALFLTSINPHSSCTGDLYSAVNDPRPQNGPFCLYISKKDARKNYRYLPAFTLLSTDPLNVVFR